MTSTRGETKRERSDKEKGTAIRGNVEEKGKKRKYLQYPREPREERMERKGGKEYTK